MAIALALTGAAWVITSVVPVERLAKEYEIPMAALAVVMLWSWVIGFCFTARFTYYVIKNRRSSENKGENKEQEVQD